MEGGGAYVKVEIHFTSADTIVTSIDDQKNFKVQTSALNVGESFSLLR